MLDSKKILFSIITCIFFSSLLIQNAYAATFFADVSGDWNDDNVWSGSGIPSAADVKVITPGVTVTIPAGFPVLNTNKIENTGIIVLHDNLQNNGVINNDNTINIFCDGSLTGNPPAGSPPNDLCDPDTDGDGVPDANDICPGFDDTIDSDADGIPDGCDINSGITCGPGTVLDSNNQCIPENPITCGPGTVLDSNNQCIPSLIEPEPVKLDGKFIGKHSENEFNIFGSLKIDDEKFKLVKGIGTFEIQNTNEKCDPIAGQGQLELTNESFLNIEFSGEICETRFLNKGNAEFNTNGVVEQSQANGSGEISLIIGKKHFAGKLSGDIILKGSTILGN